MSSAQLFSTDPETSAYPVSATAVRLGYDAEDVVTGVDLQLPPGRFVALVGPNGCGKSTLLRGLAGLQPLRGGTVRLHGQDIGSLGPRDLARQRAVLPQNPLVPEGLTVQELAARGRFPHRAMFSAWTAADDEAVARAMQAVGVFDLAESPVEKLSGGQRQRAWIAMVLAQEVDVILLDEPTTFLDLAHASEVLRVAKETAGRGRSVLAVIHDLTLAARYADEVVVMKEGRILAQGSPTTVLTEARLAEVFGLQARVLEVAGAPVIAPL